MNQPSPIKEPAGQQLRQWRERRRLSQLQLALEVEMSTRHLSFVETGRAQPSRDMIIRLADYLDIPLRARNHILLAAGLAPEFEETGLSDPEMAEALAVVEHLLKAHEPFPALAVDRHWNMVAANGAMALLTEQIAPHLMQPPVNVLRLALHPDGLAPQIVNYEQWRSYILHRLDRDIELTADAQLAALRDELAAYPGICQRQRDAGTRHNCAAAGDRYGGGQAVVHDDGDDLRHPARHYAVRTGAGDVFPR